MKIDIVKLLIAIAISALLAYGCYSICSISADKVLLTVIGFIYFTITSIMTFGLSSTYPRTSVMVKTTSGIFFGVALIINLFFALAGFNNPTFLITNGLTFSLYVLIVSSIWKTKQ